MIRRDPTMIPMTDNDIQEVRDVLLERRQWTSYIKSDDQLEKETKQVEALKRRELKSQKERLGL